jgi:hypothetical protein
MSANWPPIFRVAKTFLDAGFLSPDRFVYHYTSRDTLFDHILGSHTLRMGPYHSLNDPWEYQHFRFQVENLPESLNLGEFQKRLSHSIRAGSRLLCTSADLPTRLHPMHFTEPDFAVGCGSGSYQFLRGYGHPRMWAQYGSNHAGVCIMLDRAKLDNKIRAAAGVDRVYSGRVRYDDNLARLGDRSIFHLQGQEIASRGVDKFIDEFAARHIQEIFFTKSIDWVNEREYRWLIKGETDEPIYVPVDGAIQAIIVGERFQMNYLPSLYPFAEKLNFLILKCFWNNGDPMLSPDYSAPVPSL